MASRSTSIVEGARLMREGHTGSIIVCDMIGGLRRPVGIVSDHDLVIEILAQEAPAEQVSLGDIMTLCPSSARENGEIFETLQRMRSLGLRRMPVLDDNGALVGLIALENLIELIEEELEALVALLREERRREMEIRAFA